MFSISKLCRMLSRLTPVIMREHPRRSAAHPRLWKAGVCGRGTGHRCWDGGLGVLQKLSASVPCFVSYLCLTLVCSPSGIVCLIVNYSYVRLGVVGWALLEHLIFFLHIERSNDRLYFFFSDTLFSSLSLTSLSLVVYSVASPQFSSSQLCRSVLYCKYFISVSA